MYNKNTTSKQLRKLRESLGFNQQEFANLVGYSDKTISAWENGTRIIKFNDVVKILNMFHLTFSDFFNIGLENDLKTHIYVCKKCGNIIFSPKSINVSCCGLDVIERDNIEYCLKKEYSVVNRNGIIYIYAIHEQIYDHFINFIAYRTEKSFSVAHFKYTDKPVAEFLDKGDGQIILSCTRHGSQVFEFKSHN